MLRGIPVFMVNYMVTLLYHGEVWIRLIDLNLICLLWSLSVFIFLSYTLQKLRQESTAK